MISWTKAKEERKKLVVDLKMKAFSLIEIEEGDENGRKKKMNRQTNEKSTKQKTKKSKKKRWRLNRLKILIHINSYMCLSPPFASFRIRYIIMYHIYIYMYITVWCRDQGEYEARVNNCACEWARGIKNTMPSDVIFFESFHHIRPNDDCSN